MIADHSPTAMDHFIADFFNVSVSSRLDKCASLIREKTAEARRRTHLDGLIDKVRGYGSPLAARRNTTTAAAKMSSDEMRPPPQTDLNVDFTSQDSFSSTEEEEPRSHSLSNSIKSGLKATLSSIGEKGFDFNKHACPGEVTPERPENFSSTSFYGESENWISSLFRPTTSEELGEAVVAANRETFAPRRRHSEANAPGSTRRHLISRPGGNEVDARLPLRHGSVPDGSRLIVTHAAAWRSMNEPRNASAKELPLKPALKSRAIYNQEFMDNNDDYSAYAPPTYSESISAVKLPTGANEFDAGVKTRSPAVAPKMNVSFACPELTRSDYTGNDGAKLSSPAPSPDSFKSDNDRSAADYEHHTSSLYAAASLQDSGFWSESSSSLCRDVSNDSMTIDALDLVTDQDPRVIQDGMIDVEDPGMRIVGGKPCMVDGVEQFVALVTRVVSGGNAERLGIAVGAEIVEWNGISLADCTFDQVRAVQQPDNATSKLVKIRWRNRINEEHESQKSVALSPFASTSGKLQLQIWHDPTDCILVVTVVDAEVKFKDIEQPIISVQVCLRNEAIDDSEQDESFSTSFERIHPSSHSQTAGSIDWNHSFVFANFFEEQVEMHSVAISLMYAKHSEQVPKLNSDFKANANTVANLKLSSMNLDDQPIFLEF